MPTYAYDAVSSAGKRQRGLVFWQNESGGERRLFTGIGAKIESGKVGFEELETYMLKKGEAATNVSGRQEYLENLINEFI